jgi:hypothetical protein
LLNTQRCSWVLCRFRRFWINVSGFVAILMHMPVGLAWSAPTKLIYDPVMPAGVGEVRCLGWGLYLGGGGGSSVSPFCHSCVTLSLSGYPVYSGAMVECLISIFPDCPTKLP